MQHFVTAPDRAQHTVCRAAPACRVAGCGESAVDALTEARHRVRLPTESAGMERGRGDKQRQSRENPGQSRGVSRIRAGSVPSGGSEIRKKQVTEQQKKETESTFPVSVLGRAGRCAGGGRFVLLLPGLACSPLYLMPIGQAVSRSDKAKPSTALHLLPHPS